MTFSTTVALVTVAALIAGGRWASYIGYGLIPVYLADVGLAVALIGLAFNSRRHAAFSVPPSILAPVWALIAWAVIRALIDGEFTLTALRTLAPFLYGAFALLGAQASVRHPQTTKRWILRALIVRVWLTTFALLAPEFVKGLPEVAPGINVLQPRADLDGAVAVVFALYVILTRVGRPSRLYVATAFAAATNVAALSASRAPLLAAVLTGLTVSRLRSHKERIHSDRRVLLAVASMLLAFALVAGGATRLLGESATRLGDLAGKVVGGEGLTQDGTSRARVLAWSKVLDYSTDRPERSIAGIAFAKDFLNESGAKRYLQDNDDSGRVLLSPHNYLLGVLARLGAVGVLLVSVLLASVLLAYRKVDRGRSGAEDRDLAMLSVTLVLVFFCVALLGVVLEGPAGAVPWFYCAGSVLWLASSKAGRNAEERTEGDSSGHPALGLTPLGHSRD
jgi:hypothetical protein